VMMMLKNPVNPQDLVFGCKAALSCA